MTIECGIKIISDFVKTLPALAGVYRMLDNNDTVLYVGKAKNLKKRVGNYTHINRLSTRLQRMVSETVRMEYTQLRTEAEALLVETNQIKKLKPRYNILMRDDKSFPYIAITKDNNFPRVLKYRGAKQKQHKYFGPFASAGDVNRTLATLQKAFQLRDCTDNVFANRSRPCLQYQIKRCTAPCVDFVSKANYAKQVKLAEDFLLGKTVQIQKHFAKKMQIASDLMDFEQAAIYRDKIKALTAVQSYQNLSTQSLGNADVAVITKYEGKSCVLIFFYRAGQYYGNHASYPKHHIDDTSDKILSAFLLQFYESHPAPEHIYLNIELEEQGLIEEVISKSTDKNIQIAVPKRGKKKEIINKSVLQAESQCMKYVASLTSQKQLLGQLAELLNITKALKRVEVYDNSHISGTNAIGAMIVAGEEGFIKSAYRKFNIKSDNIVAGDDYAMMREVLTRRFEKAQQDGLYPDLVILDGGLGQLNAGLEVFKQLNINIQDVSIIAVAKGVDRNAGRERIFIPNQAEPISLPKNDALLHFIQRIRDESHRFVIGAHRTRRKNSAKQSPLDEIKGIGAKRKKALLLHFGSAKSIAGAEIVDLEAVDGISKEIAIKLYEYFH